MREDSAENGRGRADAWQSAEAARVRTIEAQRAMLRERFGFTEADEQRALDRVLRTGAGTPAGSGADPAT